MSTPLNSPPHEAEFGLSIGAIVLMPRADREEAWRRAELAEKAVADALAGLGVLDGAPLVNVWKLGTP